MVDEPGQGAKDPAQETIFNSDIGDDWGEAFEAEDFMSAPKKEASQEFFLPDEPEDTLSAIPVADEGQAASTPSATPVRIPSLLHTFLDRFRRTTIAVRLAIILLPLIGVALFLALNRSPKHVASTSAGPAKSVADHPTPQGTAEPHQQQPASTGHETPPPPIAHGEPPAVHHAEPPPEVKPIRKKWRFPAVIVHAKTQAEQPPIIVTTDLTLILRLSPEAIPPAQRESFVRETLYQFFNNQPPDDLRRYALERGEMNRKLQAWLLKQWPDLPLDAIAIDRYQLL